MSKDCRGLMMTGSDESVRRFDATFDDFLAYGNRTMELLKETLSGDPGFVMGHCLQGYLMLLMQDGRLAPRARKAHGAALANAHLATPRERAHVDALGAWLDRGLEAPLPIWEQILLEHPLDALALRLAHFDLFQLGEAPAMRDSIARVLYAWDDSTPGYGFVLGMKAFGLEESGDYGRAEEAGRRAVDINPGDIWAAHAVAHVIEMQGRFRDGVRWIDATEPGWKDRNFFRYHVYWHRALYLLETENYDDILDLYDSEVRADQSERYLDMTNAIAMLVRLRLRGVDVGSRWRELADKCALRIADAGRPFNDSHFLMALLADGRMTEAAELLANTRKVATMPGAVAQALNQQVGVPLLEGIHAWMTGEFATAVARLMPIRYALFRIGGSHAQRDIYQLTLIDSALQSGQFGLARALLGERTALKPSSPWAWSLAARALGGLGDRVGARCARVRADQLLAA